MNSFGLWYTKNKKKKNDRGDVNSEDVDFEIHINLWSKLKAEDDEKTYLDIGIKVFNYQLINRLIFMCPFKLEKNDLLDLSSKISCKENTDLILNNNSDIETKENYVIIKDHEKHSRYLVFPFEQAVSGVVDIKSIDKMNSKVIIKFGAFIHYINDLSKKESNNNIKLNEINIIYIRFRIKSKELKDILFNNLQPLDNFLQSGFVSTQIIDFKINNIRNISPSILAMASRQNEELVKFKKVHFLLMEPSQSTVVCMSNPLSCRNLEENLWNDYLDVNPQEKIPSMLAYHWIKNQKVVNNENSDDKENYEKVKEFNQLVKITYAKTNRRIILKYVLFVILFGAAGSIIGNVLWLALTNIRSIILFLLKSFSASF